MKKIFILAAILTAHWGVVPAKGFFNVADYGAKGDGKTNETALLQKVIDLCRNQGGGTVFFPTGTYISGTLFLKDSVMLNLDRGAVIKGSSNLNDYPDLVNHRKGLIHCENARFVGICGSGTIDANGKDTVFQRGSNSPYRIYGINFEKCTSIDIRDISVKGSSYWTLRIDDCDMVQIRGVKISSTNYFNNDGIDLDGRNITVSDCIIDCIDDGICLKSYYRERPCENIAINNCIVSSNCNAIKLGTASEGGFKNIAISNCIVKRPSQNDLFDYKKYIIPGVTENYVNNSGIALELVDGGIMEQITISNITMYNTLTPIFIRLGQRRNPPAGYMKDIVISNITATCNSLMSSSITGIKDRNIENIKLSHIILNCPGGGLTEHADKTVPESDNSYPENKIFGADLPAYGFFVRHANNVDFNDIQFNLSGKDDRYAVYLEDCQHVVLDKVKSKNHNSVKAFIKSKEVVDLLISGFGSSREIPLFLHYSGDNTSDIKLLSNDFSKIKQLYNKGTKDSPAPVKELNNLK